MSLSSYYILKKLIYLQNSYKITYELLWPEAWAITAQTNWNPSASASDD